MRKPDVSIQRDAGDQEYLDRWWVIPHNRWFNVYLHRFVGSDYDGALHDHPWWSVSFLLKGVLKEILFQHPELGVKSHCRMRKIIPFWPYLRKPTHMHRMILESDEAWTLFITGPELRPWGFETPQGWVKSDQFLSERYKEQDHLQ